MRKEELALNRSYLPQNQSIRLTEAWTPKAVGLVWLFSGERTSGELSGTDTLSVECWAGMCSVSLNGAAGCPGFPAPVVWESRKQCIGLAVLHWSVPVARTWCSRSYQKSLCVLNFHSLWNLKWWHLLACSLPLSSSPSLGSFLPGAGVLFTHSLQDPQPPPQSCCAAGLRKWIAVERSENEHNSDKP